MVMDMIRKLRGPGITLLVITPAYLYAQATPPTTPQSSGTSSANRSIPAPAPAPYTPPTGRELAGQYVGYIFGPFAFAGAGAAAGIGQWRDSPHEWGQGGEGYAKRFASAFGANIVRGTLMYGTASVVHEDVRYVPQRTGSFGSRLTHALAGTFTARHRDGTQHVSIARITAFTGAALISRAWQPKSTSGLQWAAGTFGASVGMSMGLDVFREFLGHKQQP
jgi:hypothetical protein